MASSAKGLVSPARLDRVLFTMVGMGSRSRLHTKPAAMPNRMGFVTMPLRLFLIFSPMPLLADRESEGLSSVRMTTAKMLYSGTLPRIIRPDMPEVP